MKEKLEVLLNLLYTLGTLRFAKEGKGFNIYDLREEIDMAAVTNLASACDLVAILTEPNYVGEIDHVTRKPVVRRLYVGPSGAAPSKEDALKKALAGF